MFFPCACWLQRAGHNCALIPLFNGHAFSLMISLASLFLPAWRSALTSLKVFSVCFLLVGDSGCMTMFVVSTCGGNASSTSTSVSSSSTGSIFGRLSVEEGVCVTNIALRREIFLHDAVLHLLFILIFTSYPEMFQFSSESKKGKICLVVYNIRVYRCIKRKVEREIYIYTRKNKIFFDCFAIDISVTI